MHTQTSGAPIPSQILTAKKLFIGNAGGEFDTRDWTGPFSRTYKQFYAETKSSGKYELVDTPSDSDLVLEISFVDEIFCRGDDPQFRLAVIDPKTHVKLWALVSHIPHQSPSTRKGRDEKFDEALAKLARSFQELSTGQSN
jgi:hypothetical protein